MLNVRVRMDREELAGVLGESQDELENICHGDVDAVLREAEGDLEGHFLQIVSNHEYDLADVVSEAIDRVGREKMRQARRQAKRS